HVSTLHLITIYFYATNYLLSILTTPPHPKSTLFPYTTLFRSHWKTADQGRVGLKGYGKHSSSDGRTKASGRPERARRPNGDSPKTEEPLLNYHTLPTDCRNEDCRCWR